MIRSHQDIIGDQNRELEQLRREIAGHLKAWDIEHAEVGRLRLKLGQAEKIAKLLPESAAEIERLRAAILMAENRLEAAHTGNDDVCRACVDVARSYLQTALKDKP